MALGALAWLYRRLGGRYPALFLTLELQTAFLITAGTLALFTFYWEMSQEEFLLIFGIAMALTAVAVALNLMRTYPLLKPVRAWIDGDRSERTTAEAWLASVNLPMGLLKRDFALPFLIVVLPSTIAAVAILGLSWLTFFPFFFGSAVAVSYGGLLHYLALEVGMRPVLIDINEAATPQLQSDVSAFPLRVKLLGALPLINLICGLVVAALTSGGSGGGTDLTVDVLVAVAVATVISLELSLLLSRSILRPIADVQRATEAVREGRYDVRVPVTTGDELGDLAASFNEMISGLAERERIRDAFGTYLDEEVAEYILSEGFSEEGVELDVSVLFCDVRDFTRLASGMDAKEVVAALNRLFEVVVPIVARHGGHVDKFEGDGLLAVFGAPEAYPDHATRAVRAACAMASAVNDRDEAGSEIHIGVGVNTGRVVAGAVGGAGRLNFSVIGDPVNVAARVEDQTRRLDASVLITEATATKLSERFEVDDRGRHELRGIEGRVTLFEPHLVLSALPASGDGDGRDGDRGNGLGWPIAARMAARAARRAAARATTRQE